MFGRPDEKQDQTPKWKEAIISFLDALYGQARYSISEFTRIQKERLINILLGASFTVMGVLFLSNSAAIFINDFFEKSKGVGYAFTGALLIAIGLSKSHRNNHKQ